MADRLRFPADAYTVEHFCVQGADFAVRAWRNLRYCTAPTEEIQRLDLYAPERFFTGGRINGYGADNAPIFLPNTVGGYMPGPPAAPAVDGAGRPNTALSALLHGYVVACPGVRGRSQPTGKAPALIVDMKAAIRYLRHNAARIPGDTEKMITSGTSAGGALSALAGATGNAADYAPLLAAIGAADERDDVFAASCYCPIINLENADAAYEWQFCGETAYNGWHGAGTLTEAQQALARQLAPLFPPCLNALGLQDEAGRPLTLSSDGTGPFLDWVIGQVIRSAQRALDAGDPTVREQAFLTIADGRVTGLDWPAYIHAITRMKTPPAFDAADLSSPENDLFGAPGQPRHFTAFDAAQGHALADPATVRMLNPMAYIGQADAAPHFRIRHGSHDRDASLAISAMFTLSLRQHGIDADLHYPWCLPHSGDYDLPELFRWIDDLC